MCVIVVASTTQLASIAVLRWSVLLGVRVIADPGGSQLVLTSSGRRGSRCSAEHEVMG